MSPVFDLAGRKPRANLGDSPAELIRTARSRAQEAPLAEGQALPDQESTPTERARQDGLQALLEYVQALVAMVPTDALIDAYEPLKGATAEEREAAAKAIDEATVVVELQYDQYEKEAGSWE